MTRIAIVGVCGLLLMSCAMVSQFKKIGPERQTVGTYSIDPQIAWSRKAAGKFEVWTVDGPALEEVSFANGIMEGEPVVELAPPEQVAAAFGRDAPRPVFRKDMTASEIAELVTDTLAGIGFIDVEAHDLRPFDFGGRPGFRFELTMLTPESLPQRGLAAGKVEGGRLHLIIFRAASDYYYPKYQETVERMLGSITNV